MLELPNGPHSLEGSVRFADERVFKGLVILSPGSAMRMGPFGPIQGRVGQGR